MPTREQLIEALRQADASGDEAGAARFAEMIKSMGNTAPAGKKSEDEGFLPSWLYAPKGSTTPKNTSKIPGIIDAFTSGVVGGLGPQATGMEAAVLGKTPEGDWFNYEQSMGDRYAAARDAERAQMQQFAETNPVSAMAAETAGLIAGPGKAANAAGKLLPQAVKTVAPRTAAVTGQMATGAALGGTLAAGQGEDIEEGMAEGVVAGLAGTVAAKLATTTASKAIGLFRKRASKASVDELHGLSKGAFDYLDNSPAQYKMDKFEGLRQEINGKLAKGGYRPATPGMAPLKVILDEIDGIVTNNDTVGVQGIMSLRKLITTQMRERSNNPEAKMWMREILGKLDDFGAKQSNIWPTTGNAKEIADTYAFGRDMWRRKSKIERVRRFFNDAMVDGGDEKQIRANMRRMLKSDKWTWGMTADERKALTKAATGGGKLSLQRTLELLGRGTPDNLVKLGAAATATAYAPHLAVPAITGAIGAKLGANALARRSVGELERLIGVGGNANELFHGSTPYWKRVLDRPGASKPLAGLLTAGMLTGGGGY